MKDEIFFSVIVPTYNRAYLITETIESLLNQQYSSFEIIIVDDGSTDDTENVVKQIVDKRVTYYKKKNEERGTARNFGAAKAKGSYVNFFDSDDIAFSNHLSTAAAAINCLGNPEVIHLGYDIVQENIKTSELIKAGELNELIQKKSCISCNAVFLRKDIIEKYPFSTIRDLSVSEDLLLWLRLSARFPIHAIPTVTSSVIIHDSRSTITDVPEKTLTRMNLLIQELEKDDIYMNKYGHKYLKYVKSEKMMTASFIYALQKKKIKSLKLLAASLSTAKANLFTRRFLAVVKYLIIKW